MQFHLPTAIVAGVALLGMQAYAYRPAPALAASTGAFASADTPGGGHVIKGFLGEQASLQSAAVTMLRELHAALGSRPSIVSIAQNPGGHSIAIVFESSSNGRKLKGMSLVTAAPGSEASGEAVYDSAERLPKTMAPMLRQLATMQSPQAPDVAFAHAPLAPAEPMMEQTFADGTGSMAVPADWSLKGGGGGSAVAVGPTGREVVNFNFTQGALEPGSTMGQMLVNGTGIYPAGPLQENGMKSLVLLHYTGDPVAAWRKSWAQMAKQARRPGPSFVVDKVTRTGPHTAFVSGTGAYGSDPSKPFVYYAYLNIGPLSRLGQWGMYFTYVIVPREEVSKESATATAVLASVKIDFGRLNGMIADSARAFQQQFESEIANDRALDAARQRSTDDSIAAANANADAMRKQAVGMVNYVLDRSAVLDRETGGHALLDSDYASALAQSNPNFQILRPSELINGVDY